MAKLKDIGVIITGNTPKTSDPKNYETTDIPFIKPSDISDDAISYLHNSEFYISEYAREKSRIVPVDSILFTCIGIIGKIAVNKVECAFNQQINAIIPDKSKCLTDYLVYALQSKKRLLQETANAPVVPILNKTQFSEIEIELPSLEQQEKISVQLNKINDLISQRNLQLSKLDELVKSRFVELFEKEKYKKVTVSAVLNTAFWLMPATPEFIVDGEVPYITSKNIKNRTIDFDNVKYISREAYKSISANRPTQKGDILISMIGTLGQTAVIQDDREFYGQNLYLLRLNNSIVNTTYFCEFFNSDTAQYKLQGKRNQSTQAYLKANHVEDLLLPLPPMELQNQFAAFVEQTDKSKLAVQQSLEKLEALKKSLMQQYFG